MSFRTEPQSVEEHIAYIYEQLRRIRVPVVIAEGGGILSITGDSDSFVPDDPCPCIINIRVCPGGS